MGEKALSNYSFDAYLALEAESETKYEFHDGMITAMAGGTPEHGQIAMNFGRGVGNSIVEKGKTCIVYSSDVKVHIASSKRIFYPDASIVCEKPVKSDTDPHAITNPILIVEVLSESTAMFDLGEKFAHYRDIPSLREYVIISQTQPTVHTYYRTDNGTWEITTISKLSDTVVLKSIGCEVSMADIYLQVPGIEEKEDII
ncbi:MAG: Uma2 family endonuclease [Bacteroidetes bacterium]|nr:Uma2 family endonuclease [Bacteroidota bacterium]